MAENLWKVFIEYWWKDNRNIWSVIFHNELLQIDKSDIWIYNKFPPFNKMFGYPFIQFCLLNIKHGSMFNSSLMIIKAYLVLHLFHLCSDSNIRIFYRSYTYTYILIFKDWLHNKPLTISVCNLEFYS